MKKSQRGTSVLYGGSWVNVSPDIFQCTVHGNISTIDRYVTDGFRAVITLDNNTIQRLERIK